MNVIIALIGSIILLIIVIYFVVKPTKFERKMLGIQNK